MKTQFDIDTVVEKGIIQNELDYDRALIADRKLRLLAKDNPYFKSLRKKLRSIIEIYESLEWKDVEKIDQHKLIESEKAERAAEEERKFLETRKNAIRARLKEFDLTQENLALLLGHKSKTYMSELMNGIKPFTLRDLTIISWVLKIEIKLLVPVFLSNEDQIKVKEAAIQLANPKLKISRKNIIVI